MTEWQRGDDGEFVMSKRCKVGDYVEDAAKRKGAEAKSEAVYQERRLCKGRFFLGTSSLRRCDGVVEVDRLMEG